MGPVADGEPPGRDALLTQDMQPAQRVGGLVDHAVHLLAVGGVKGHGDGAAARGLGDLRSGRFQVGHGARADHHVGALACQFQGDCLADAAAGAAHKCQFAFKSKIHKEMPPSECEFAYQDRFARMAAL